MSIWYPQARAILQVMLDGLAGDDADSETLVIPILPKSVTVHINSYRQADSFEMVFDAGDLPFDPSLIRAGAAEIFVFQTGGVDDKQRVLSRKEPLADPDTGGVRNRTAIETLALELETPETRDRFTLGHKPRIVGLFDDDDMELSDSGKWVTIKGQDYTAFLIGMQWKPQPSGQARRIPTGKRLDLILEDILREADPDEHLALDVRGLARETLPIVGANEVSGNKRGIPVEQSTTYWDVIYKLAERHGFIAFVDGLDVVLSRPKTITDKDTTTIRRLAWGKNLSHLSLRRHLGAEQAPTMVVKSYDPRTRQTISVEYPEGQIDRSVLFTAKKNGHAKIHRRTVEKTHTSKKGKVRTTIRSRDEYQIATVYGVTDPAALKRIAENRYHLLGKAERTINATTRDLRDLEGTDLLDVATGDAFTIEWDEFNRELLANPKLSAAQKLAHLLARGFNSEVAKEIAAHYEILAGLTRPVRFKEGTIEYDSDDGISIEMELQDFIVIDGIRPDSGAVPADPAQRVDGDGAAIGWSPAKLAAMKRRYAR